MGILTNPVTLIFFQIGAKEKMNKKNKDGAAFTDDGLAMGKQNVSPFLSPSRRNKLAL